MADARLLRDSAYNIAPKLLAALFGIVTVPLLLSHLDPAPYADWIITLSTIRLVTLVDFGIGWTIVHRVAQTHGQIDTATTELLRSAAALLLGLAIMIMLLGLAVDRLALGEITGYRWPILGSLAAMLLCAPLSNYAQSVLFGLRRFDLSASVVGGEALLSGAGMIVILLSGYGIAVIAVWQAAIALLATLANLSLVVTLAPAAAFRPALRLPADWRSLLHFSLTSQLSEGMARSFWDLAVFLVAEIGGPIAVVAFHVAQKIPLAIAALIGRAAEVAMPAASEQLARVERQALAVQAAHVTALLALPTLILVTLCAVPFLRLWIPDGSSDLAPLMILTTLGVTLSGLGESGRCFLWGSGQVVTVVKIQLIGLPLLALAALPAAVTGQFNGLVFATLQVAAIAWPALLLSRMAANSVGLAFGDYLRRSLHGLLPACCAGLAAGSPLLLAPPASWTALALEAAASGTSLAIILWRTERRSAAFR